MSGNKSKIIAFNYFGGKFTWLDYLYAHFPSDFNHLVDVFGGSFCVSLNYPGRIIKTANEINGEITNFFRILRDREAELIRALELTPVSQCEFSACWNVEGLDDLERARRFYIRVRQSFFGLGAQRQNKGWHMAKTQNNAKGGETVSKWNNSIPKLHKVAKVLRQNFQITNMDYREVIQKTDFKKAFFYCDPPYPKESRASFNDYKFEFSTKQHEDLAEVLHSIKGKAMVSSYNSDLYERLYADWHKVEFPVKKNNIRSGEVREVIWTNYQPHERNLFTQ